MAKSMLTFFAADSFRFGDAVEVHDGRIRDSNRLIGHTCR